MIDSISARVSSYHRTLHETEQQNQHKSNQLDSSPLRILQLLQLVDFPAIAPKTYVDVNYIRLISYKN